MTSVLKCSHVVIVIWSINVAKVKLKHAILSDTRASPVSDYYTFLNKLMTSE